MTVLEVSKFMEHCEKRWEGEKLLVWVPGYMLQIFTTMIFGMLNDGGIDCRLQHHGVICIDFVPVCEHYGIEAEHLFPNPDALIQPTV